MRRRLDETLTEYEKDVIQLISIGKTNDEIGLILGISARAVARRIDRAWKVSETRTRTQLACKAIREGWIA